MHKILGLFRGFFFRENAVFPAKFIDSGLNCPRKFLVLDGIQQLLAVFKIVLEHIFIRDNFPFKARVYAKPSLDALEKVTDKTALRRERKALADRLAAPYAVLLGRADFHRVKTVRAVKVHERAFKRLPSEIFFHLPAQKRAQIDVLFREITVERLQNNLRCAVQKRLCFLGEKDAFSDIVGGVVREKIQLVAKILVENLLAGKLLGGFFR